MEEEIIEKDMTPVLLKDLGMRFATENSKQKLRYGLYQCQYCGKEFEVITYNINSVHTKSCGCQAKANSKTHGLRKHPIYPCWKAMRDRCGNLNSTAFKDYGGRGIKVCDRWLDVANFIEDMYPSYEEGLTLDRIDVNGNYELENCRWVTQSVQMQNTRDIQSNNTSGFRGVSWSKRRKYWVSKIMVSTKYIYLGLYPTALEAAKAYETYVRVNNLEHNFTPALTEEEIEELN